MPIHQTLGHVMPAGAFDIGTGEFAIKGLMPDIARNLNLSESQASHAISTYALGVMVGAPAAGHPRR